MRYRYYAVVQDLNGNVVSGASVSVYLAGTTTPVNIYTSPSGGAGINTPPQFITGADGTIEFWVEHSEYSYGQLFKLVIQSDTVTKMVDNVQIINWATTPYTIDAAGAVTGQLVQFDTANVKLKPVPIYVVSGNVGVGITSPAHKLHVAGNIGIQAGENAFIGTVDNYNLSLRTNNTDRIVIDTGGNITFQGTAVNQPRLRINAVSTASYALSGLDYFIDGAWIGGYFINQQTKSIMFVQTTGGSTKIVAAFPYSTSTAEGQLTMFIPDPVHGTYKSDFPSGWYGGLGTYNITCAGIYYDTLQQRSDASIKTDIQSLSDYLNTDCLDVISCLKPIKYVYTNDLLKTNRFGFIAQDVSEVCPELVTIDTEGKASLNYMDLIALLTSGIQELYEMLDKVIQKIGGIS
jgi:hypothetical protein